MGRRKKLHDPGLQKKRLAEEEEHVGRRPVYAENPGPLGCRHLCSADNPELELRAREIGSAARS